MRNKRKKRKVWRVGNNYYPVNVSPVIYPQAAPVAVAAAQIQPVYVQQQQAVAAVCCCPCPPYPPQHPPAAVPPSAPAPGQPGGGPLSPPPAGSDVPQADASDQEIQAIATKTCISCHGDTNPKGGISFVDVTRLTSEQRMRASLLIMNGTMPKGNAAAVSDAEAQAWLNWSLKK